VFPLPRGRGRGRGNRLDELARRMVTEGEAEEKIDEMAIPEPFDDWLFAAFFAPSMHFLVQRQLSRQTGVSA
jgi:hypothetical protein